VAHTDATHLYRVDVPSAFSWQAAPSASSPKPTPTVLQSDESAKYTPWSVGPAGAERSHHSPCALQLLNGEVQRVASAAAALVGTSGTLHSRTGAPAHAGDGKSAPR